MPDVRANDLQSQLEAIIGIYSNSCCGADGTETYHATAASGTAVSFTNQVHAQVLDHGGLDNRGVKIADFTVIANANMPAAMTFMGFIDHGVDGPKMATNSWRKEVARGLMHALQQTMGYGEFTP